MPLIPLRNATDIPRKSTLSQTSAPAEGGIRGQVA